MARAVPGAASPPIPPFCEAETQTERVDLFECNICLDSANEPVVTFCGHLYCWPCIYRWLQVSTAPLCPVCKTTVTQKKLVPVYGRGKPHMDPRVSTVVPPAHTSPGIPSRPHGRRPESHRRSSSGGAAGLQPGDVLLPPPALAGGQSFGLLGASWTAHAAAPFGVGFAPSFAGVFPLGFQFISHVVQPGAHSGAGEARSPEHAQQAFLSRLLLLLGSFVILCLLLF